MVFGVLEVVPPWSRRQDERELPPLYAKIGVPEFFIHDPYGKLEPPLAGFELQGGAYQPLPTEPLGRGLVGIRSKMLGLCLYIRPPNPDRLTESSLGWYDPTAGEFLPTRRELAARARAAEAAAREAEATARLAESEARLAELEAQIEEMRRERE